MKTQVAAYLLLSAACVASAYYYGSNLLLDFSMRAALLAAGLMLLAGLFRKRWRPVVAAIWMIVAALAYPMLAHHFHLQKFEEVKRYVTRISPLLEKYKMANGNYPHSLDDVPDLPPSPAPIEYGILLYGYEITFRDPQNFDYDLYDSNRQAWRRDN